MNILNNEINDIIYANVSKLHEYCNKFDGKSLIDIYATREKEDDSDECEVVHERSESAKTRVRIILFLPRSIHYLFLCMHRNGHFFAWNAERKSPFWGIHEKCQSENSTETILDQL